MKVFVTGATGFVGSAIVRELIAAGHQVVGLARSNESAAFLVSLGAEAHQGLLEDLDSLRSGATTADGVIHTAFTNPSPTTKLEDAAHADLRAIETLGEALAGSGRPFVVTSAIGALPPGRVGTEEDAPDAHAVGGHRVASELAALGLASNGVRVSVVRLPLSVQGVGDHGFVPTLIDIARAKGVSAYPDDGSNRWCSVHVLDAARVYRLALEHAPAGARFHAVAEEGIPVREIAAIIGRRLNVPVMSLPVEEMSGHFTWLARFFSSDQPASSVLTQQRLGWQPKQVGLLADIDRPAYFEA